MDTIIKYIIPINTLIDVLLIFNKNLGLLRAGIMLLLILHLIVIFRGHHRHYNAVFVFAIYTLTIAMLSSNVGESMINSLKILIPIVSVLIGFHFFNTKEKIKTLADSMNATLLILVANFLICNTLGIGEQSRYMKGEEESTFLMGQLTDNWNMFTYSILTVPIILQVRKKKERFATIFGAGFNVILVLLSVKRIAMLGLFLGLLINLSYAYSIRRMITIFAIAISGIVLAYPLYADILAKRFEARADRFEDGALEKESRFLETVYVWEDALSFKSMDKSLFGMEAFNSAGNYANGKFGDRQLHVDYNNIVNTIGLVGLFLYLLIFVQIWRSFKKVIKNMVSKDSFTKTMKATFYTFFIVQFITSLAGQMYNITFRLILFVFLGSVLGYFYQQSVQSKSYSHEGIDS